MQIPVKVDLPVGENLQDHLQVPLFVELKSPVSLNVMKLLSPGQMWNYFAHGKGNKVVANGLLFAGLNIPLIIFTGPLATSGIEGIATLTKPKKDGETLKPYGMLILFNMGSINADIYTSVANIKKEVRPATGKFTTLVRVTFNRMNYCDDRFSTDGSQRATVCPKKVLS